MRPFLSLALLLPSLSAPAFAADAPPALTIEQVMAEPDWIGPPVERAWWRWDSQQVHYDLKREGSPVRDTFTQSIGGEAARQVDEAGRRDLDVANPLFDATRQRAVFVRNGDIFVRDLRNGALTQLTRTEAAESQPRFATDGGVIWRSGQDWYRSVPGGGIAQAAVVKAERDPAADPKPDTLREQQLRVIETLARDRANRDAVRDQNQAWQRTDATRTPMPVYLGDDVSIVDTSLSPDARWLLVATQKKGADAGQAGKMPLYVTESGYEETETVRTRVGRNDPLPQTLWLVDIANARATELKYDALPGIGTDPLAHLRKQAGKDPLKGLRPVRLEGGRGPGSAIDWSPDGRNVALMLHAVDNKDRWIASVDLANARLQPRHRLTDAAWINWDFNDFGWLPDNQTLWWLSEESGWSHLYTQQGNGRARQHTSGRWEVSSPTVSADGRGFLFLCNRAWPGDYEVCRLNLDTGALDEVTSLDGVEDFSLSPDGQRLLVRHSQAYLPQQAAVVALADGSTRTLTDTRSAAFKARTWIEPEIVQVPSKHGAGTVWGKYYGPKTLEPGKQYPIALFVHGAGYLQNVHARYPYYFREQMFHNLLVERGYIVLDLDFRASAGYGRDWRTAIYRQMGHPELEDYLDGLDWLVEQRQGNRDRAGIYGGSYGGFMTFMALFRKPGTFKAGAALRPVVDWHHYNHGYTSNILNTPDIDPEAYRKSSPIEYAEGLQDNLLIAHGVMDDNVFYQDSVLLAQRLIELRKDDWEMASYPLERHGFSRADSWLDQYKRILKLFETTLRPEAQR